MAKQAPLQADRPPDVKELMPFMDEPPGAKVSGTLINLYGRMIRALRGSTNKTANDPPGATVALN